MISRADQRHAFGAYFQATQRIESTEKFKHSWGPRNREISDAESYSSLCSLNDSECEKPGKHKCLEQEKEVTEYAKQFQLGH